MLESLLKIIPPLLIAGCAGYLPYRAGILNIGLEGLMAIGAFFGFLAAAALGFWPVGLVAGAAAGAAAGALFAWIILKLEANIFLSGLALNLAAAGILGIVSQQLFATKGVLRPALVGRAEPSGQIPDIFVLGAGAVCFFTMMFLLKKSTWGHRVIAAGEAPEALITLGIAPRRIRFQTLIISGAGCGLAGSLLSLDIAAYVPNMTGGRGWIALVALYIAGPYPLGLLGTVLLFAAASAGATMLQGVAGIPDSLLLASPFLITFIGLGVAGAARTFMGRRN